MRIKINNKFYRKEAIEETIDAFKEVCDCRILDESFEIEIMPKNSNTPNLADEFCNFALGLTKDSMAF